MGRLVICCLVFLLIVSGCSNVTSKAGDKMYDFSLKSLEHERFYLNEHNEKTVVLIFWATWCTICKKELIDFSAYNQLNNDNLTIASVCIDPENLNEVKRITESLKLDYPVLLDQEAKLFNKLDMTSVPSTLIIDNDGRIDKIITGYDNQIMEIIISRIESLLEERIQEK